MTVREYFEIFDDIFWEVADELGISAWYELFDSERFEEVENRIAKAFDETNVENVPFFLDWHNGLCADL